MGARRPLLVGRVDMVRALARDLASGGSVLLTGPAGIGKTRVAYELCRLESGAGTVAERVLATSEGASRPLGTLAPLGVVAEDDDVVRVFGKVLRRWADLGAGARPALLWVDDAHHVDPATAALVRHAVVHGVVRVVATHRAHLALPQDLEALVTEDSLPRQVVGPLSDREAARLARISAAPYRLSPRERRSIVALAEGNPLYLRELARAAARGDEDLAGGPGLDLLVGRAVLGLDPAARAVLDMVAVAEPVPRWLFREDARAVAALRAGGFVVPHGEGMLRTDHQLRRAWLLHEMGPRQAEVVGELLDRASVAGGEELDLLTRVEWSEIAGRPVDGVTLERAARLALRTGDLARFERLAAGLPDDLGGLLRVHSRIGLGQVADVPRDLDALIREGGDRVRSEAAHLLVRHEGISRGQIDRAEAALTSLERHGSEEERGGLLASRLWLWTFRGLPANADARLDEALARVRALPPGADRSGLSAALLSIVLNARGPDAAQEVLDWTDVHEDHSAVSGTGPAHAVVARTWQHVGAADGARAIREATAGLEVVRRSHDLESYALLAGSGGWALALCGEVGRAAAVSEPEAGHGSSEWFRFPDMRRLVHLGNACYLGGSEAAAALVDGVDLGEALGGPFPLPLLCARAHALAAGACGRTPDPDVLTPALEIAGRGRKHAFAAFLALECTDLGSPSEVHRAVRRALGDAHGGALDLARRGAAARVGGDLKALLEVGLDLERAGLITPALRAVGDVADAEGSLGFAARAGLLRLLARWDGVEPWWIEGTPTPRQREVAHLVAAGSAPGEVAEELVLSRRTVENHLQRVYEYLGVHSRAGLTEALCGGEPP